MEKLYILCVDDQRDVLNNVVKDLAIFSSWAIVEDCESAREAMELLNECDVEMKPVALIVCDHLMPETYGVDFLADVDKDGRFSHVKKILLTGQATHKDTIQAINSAHIDAYLEKPWQKEELQKVSRRLLTEYLFDSGRYTDAFRSVVDAAVLLKRMR